jgi:hypothetical protein
MRDFWRIAAVSDSRRATILLMHLAADRLTAIRDLSAYGSGEVFCLAPGQRKSAMDCGTTGWYQAERLGEGRQDRVQIIDTDIRTVCQCSEDLLAHEPLEVRMQQCGTAFRTAAMR